MYISLILALGVQAQGDFIVRVKEPRPAVPWTTSFEASCPGTHLRIEGFGPSRPLGRIARITVNGKAIGGTQADALARDLSRPRAVYRLEALCGQNGKGTLYLRISAGEKNANGSIQFAAGSAEITKDQIVYRPLKPSDAETFWFR